MIPMEVLPEVRVAVLLVGVVFVVYRMTRKQPVVLSADVQTQLDRLADGITHHAEVNAVLALTKTFKENEALVKNLVAYSDQVVRAALLHRINTLGQTAQRVATELARSEESDARHGGQPFATPTGSLNQQHVRIMEELMAANRTLHEFEDQQVA